MTPNKFKEIQESMLLSTLRDNFYTRQFHKNHIRTLIIILLFAVCLCFIEFFSNNYYIICSAAILSVILAYYIRKLSHLSLRFDIVIIRRHNPQLVSPQLFKGNFSKREKERDRIFFIIQREIWRNACEKNNVPQDCASLYNIKKYILSTIKLNRRNDVIIIIMTTAFSVSIALITFIYNNTFEIVILYVTFFICFCFFIYPLYNLIEAYHNWPRNRYKTLLSVIDAEINDADIFFAK